LGAACSKENNPNKVSSGYETKNHTIQIKYKGDPALKQSPVLNAQLQNNMPNQIDAGDQPFKLHNGEFMANIPHAYGQCIPEQNPVIRVNYQMSGNASGIMDFRIKAYSNQYADYGVYHEELGIQKNPELAGMNSFFDFEFPLKELLSQDKYSWMAIHNNKTHNHNMVLQARYKSPLGQMGQWKDLDTATIKHRCVPQMNTVIPQNGNGVGGYQNGDNNDARGVKPLRATPTPKTLDKVAPIPAPKPLTIKPIEQEPEAPLRLKATQ
ncbi:hypothetical protein, partial [Methylophaga sp.]|uniref:hypothetical protein n=1 Tax=Methylophaga sp. TaxID=2024840 RepID=UPI003F695AD4